MTGNRSHHTPRKRFGQNFLADPQVIDRIIRAIRPAANGLIIEIGPGQGAITESLLASPARIIAVEIDRDLAAGLQQRFPQLHLVVGDALKTDFTSLVRGAGAERATIVGNLPYNISTPLLFHLFTFREHIDAMYFMLQKEVVDRMAAPAHDPDYGRLSVMTQYHCDVIPLFDIPPHAFRPAPKVYSTFVALKPRLYPRLAIDYGHFAQLVNLAFQQRRKTLRNALASMLIGELPASFASLMSARAGELSLDDFLALSNHLAETARATSS